MILHCSMNDIPQNPRSHIFDDHVTTFDESALLKIKKKKHQ